MTWVDKSFKQKVFEIDTLEKLIEEKILNEYKLLGSYSSKGSITILIGLYSEIFLSIINDKICKITFKLYDDIEINSTSNPINLEAILNVKVYSYDDIINNVEKFIEMYNDGF